MTSRQTPRSSDWINSIKGTPLELGASSIPIPDTPSVLLTRRGACFLFIRREEPEETSAQTPLIESNEGSLLILPGRGDTAEVLRISGPRDNEVIKIDLSRRL